MWQGTPQKSVIQKWSTSCYLVLKRCFQRFSSQKRESRHSHHPRTFLSYTMTVHSRKVHHSTSYIYMNSSTSTRMLSIVILIGVNLVLNFPLPNHTKTSAPSTTISLNKPTKFVSRKYLPSRSMNGWIQANCFYSNYTTRIMQKVLTGRKTYTHYIGRIFSVMPIWKTLYWSLMAKQNSFIVPKASPLLWLTKWALRCWIDVTNRACLSPTPFTVTCINTLTERKTNKTWLMLPRCIWIMLSLRM